MVKTDLKMGKVTFRKELLQFNNECEVFLVFVTCFN